MFITFEGLDLSGKTTQAQLLVARLKALPAGKSRTLPPPLFIREPGGTRLSERLREILLDRRNLDMSELTELMLFEASRAQLVSEIIRPALQRGEIVVCDRFYDSSTAYQGYGRGLDVDMVQRVNRFATMGTDPDLTVVIDIPIELIEQRKRAAGLSSDRMESSGQDFYERVRSGYLDLARREPHRIVCVNGVRTVQQVHDEIWSIVSQALSDLRQSSEVKET